LKKVLPSTGRRSRFLAHCDAAAKQGEMPAKIIKILTKEYSFYSSELVLMSNKHEIISLILEFS